MTREKKEQNPISEKPEHVVDKSVEDTFPASAPPAIGEGSRVPFGNAAPEEPYVRAFPAYGSRTALSVVLTPVSPSCTKPSQASHC